MPKQYGQACPVAKSLELVGERWTLLLVRDLLGGARRFQDLQASLPGIAPALLSERLKVMEEHGIVARRFYSEHPPRAEYVLTDKGRELGPVMKSLRDWAANKKLIALAYFFGLGGSIFSSVSQPCPTYFPPFKITGVVRNFPIGVYGGGIRVT